MLTKHITLKLIIIAVLIFTGGRYCKTTTAYAQTSQAIPLHQEQPATNAAAELSADSIQKTLATNTIIETHSWSEAVTDTAKEGGIIAAKLLLFIVVAAISLISLILSLLSFSGAWLILLMALICMLLVNTPGWITIAIFLLISIIGEVLEAISTFYGVQKRGGSKWAGMAGLVGGILGAMLGAAVIPVVGALIGLLAGTFLGVFLVEYERLQHHGDASHIARGAFYSRLFVLFIKLVSSLAMSFWLLWCLARIVF